MRRDRRVAITGLGATTPFGPGTQALWDSVSRGQSAAGPITLFEPGDLPVRFACEVRGEPARGPGPRVRSFALQAVDEALADSGCEGRADPERTGVVFALGHLFPDTQWFAEEVQHAMNLAEEMDEHAAIARLVREVAPRHGGIDAIALGMCPQLLVGELARRSGARGAASTVSTSCPGSLQALIAAADAIRDDEADVMIAGGSESLIHPFGMLGFARMQALSRNNEEFETASRPFDRTRDGFVMGEGAGALVLEDWDHALARGAEIHAEWLGSGLTCDAYRLSDEHPEGVGAIDAIRRALEQAGTRPEDIEYVNVHGSSTPMNDRIETLVLKKSLGEHARSIPLSSTKSMIGHLIHASASVEIITTLLAMRAGVVPPTAHLERPDPRCDLDFVPREARAHRFRCALKTSFGFGGVNAAVVVAKPD